MGKGLVDTLKQEFSIEDEWVSFEIHPDTPAAGMLLSERFSGMNSESLYTRLRSMGAPVGVTFGNLTRLSNSRLALEASEFARDHGLFDAFHDRIFQAYFVDLEDIGSKDIILSAANGIGLDATKLDTALTEHTYAGKLELAQEEGARYGVTGTPTFIINGRYKVVGAQPLESFRTALRRLSNENEA